MSDITCSVDNEQYPMLYRTPYMPGKAHFLQIKRNRNHIKTKIIEMRCIVRILKYFHFILYLLIKKKNIFNTKTTHLNVNLMSDDQLANDK